MLAAMSESETNALLTEISRRLEIQKGLDAQAAREAKISRFNQTNTTPLRAKVMGAAETLRHSLKPAEIKVYDQVAVADSAPHQASFAPNVWEAEPVKLQTPTGELLRSRILGLGYYDPQTDKSILIAEPKDSIGLLEAPNRLVYEDAFDDAAADVVYTYTASSLEQDVVIRKQLPHPSEYGLDGKSIQLCVFTEFFGDVNPKRSLKSVRVQSPGDALRSAFAEDLADETVGFDGMTIVEGRAFSFANLDETVPVGKKWVVIEGRNFLVEYTLYRALEAQLEALPKMAALEPKRALQPFKKMLASRPTNPPQKTATVSKPTIRLSQNSVRSRPGVVMDYLIVNNSFWNINFGDGESKTGFAAVGQSSSDAWNWYVAPGASSAALTDLLKSDGSSSTVGIVVSNAVGQSQNTACADPMYKSYVYRDGAQHLTVTITNLPANAYDIFVYAARASADGPPTFELKRAGTSLWTKAITRRGSGWFASQWDEHEQYVRFRNIAVTNQTLLIDGYPDAAGYASLSGIQIVPSSTLPSEQPGITNLLNINFPGNTPDKIGFAAVGQTTNDFWNERANATAGASTNLKLANTNTTATGVSLLGASGAWGFAVITDLMYQNYVYGASGANTLITLTNLASGTYDFYLYGHTTNYPDNAIFEVWSDSVNWGIKETSYTGPGAFGTNWETGQHYVLFKDVAVNSNLPVVVQAKHSTYGYQNINGLQLVNKGALDSDANGLPDGWEMKWFGSLGQVATADPDGDGLSNLREYQLGFEPTRADSDGNGIIDCYESEFVWLEDAVPQGSTTSASGDTWNWVTSFNDGVGWNGGTVTPYSGSKLHLSANVTNAHHQHTFEKAVTVTRANTGDVFYAYINLDPAKMPTEIMLQFQVLENTGSYSWEHRAYWGANSINSGVNGTVSRYYMGALPASNTWVRLEVPASLVGVEGKVVEGMIFSLYSGRAAWDRAGKVTLDMDGDGLPDAWEIQNFGNLSQTATGDADGDGLNNLGEYTNGTNPNNGDTDGDGLGDYFEVTNGCNPNVAAVPDGNGVIRLNVYTPLK